MEELLTQMIQAIVDKPDEVDIKVTDTENNKIYELRVGDGDLGKVIGKRGKNIMAIRTWLNAASAKSKEKRTVLEVIE
tara:strand:- start:259 stop:492 length:234 start_codon:yes stop_codon:yes gene_type:complete